MNHPSKLLTFEENQLVFSMLGGRKESLSTTVIQLLFGTTTRPFQWQLQVTGVVCFVKDPIRKGFFIEVFDMDARQSVWEQELYSEIVYKRKEDFFHCFEGDSAFIGLSFVDTIEANHFNEKIQERIEKRRSRLASHTPTIGPPSVVVSEPEMKKELDTQHCLKYGQSEGNESSGSSWRIWKKREKKRGKKKFDKKSIGAPQTDSFIHLQGVKLGEQGGLERVDNMDNIDPRIKRFMQIAGLDQTEVSPRIVCTLGETLTDLDNQFGPSAVDEQINQKPTMPTKMKPPKLPASQTRFGDLPPPPPPPPPMHPSDEPVSSSGKRLSVKKPGGTIMEQIQEGTKLKRVEDRHPGELETTHSTLADVLDIAIRRIRTDVDLSEESEDDWSDDSDWVVEEDQNV